MTEAELTRLLCDLHELGAEEPQRLYERYGRQRISDLLEHNYLAWVPTPMGELILLGPQGRRTLKLSPFYKSPPEAAATQLVRRRVKEMLESEGCQHQGRPSRNLMLFVTSEGKKAYVLARYGDYTARSVRRVLTSVSSRLIAEGGVLLVWTRRKHQLLQLERRTNGLLTVRTFEIVQGLGDYA